MGAGRARPRRAAHRAALLQAEPRIAGPLLDPAELSETTGASHEACALLTDAHFIDLHLTLEVPVRLYGYDPHRAHGPWRRVRPFFGHTDYPRLTRSGFSGLVYDIATNPFRPARNRADTTITNLQAALARIRSEPERMGLVRTRAEYEQVAGSGRMAVWLALQGGNGLASLDDFDRVPQDALHRVTLVHLTNSSLGGTSAPSGPDRGLTDFGRAFVERCNERRVLVDLSHAGPTTFADALRVHDKTLPPIVSHTGVSGVRPHWRNLSDAQVRIIAERGGVVGIIYHSAFLERSWLRGKRAAILDHIDHVRQVAGEDTPAIGTDYDGMIIPPADLPDVTLHPLLVDDMLRRGWSETFIRKVLGLNYLRVVGEVRP